MRGFDKSFFLILLSIGALFLGMNLYLIQEKSSERGRPYRVEINRLARAIAENGFADIDLSGCSYVTHIEKLTSDSTDFYNGESDYAIRDIRGELYRFDYNTPQQNRTNAILGANLLLGALSALLMAILLFIRAKIILPFEKLKETPYELSRGNLTMPLKESKSRYFGRFVWGMNLLREQLEQQKERELNLQREKKLLLLSLSHDIKTPLSAIKLYAKALSKGLYKDADKQLAIVRKIDDKADEIEGYLSQIISASREEFRSLSVTIGEFYLSRLMRQLEEYYSEKLSLTKTAFTIGSYTDCLLSGDLDRSIEVLQNIMENAIKYGDGKQIGIAFSEEEGCLLISVSNSGCTLPDAELPYIFDSFWRGSNAGNYTGSGLGLSICRQLMHKMNGDIFATCAGNTMTVVAVFPISA